MQRGQRHQSEGSGNSPPSGAEVAEEQRRARKRQTDRLAQQQHRKRQKLYIEQLETQLNILKSSDQSEVARLATQNFQLREEVKQMHNLWDEMESLLQRQRELRRRSALSDVSPEPMEQPQPPEYHQTDPGHVQRQEQHSRDITTTGAADYSLEDQGLCSKPMDSVEAGPRQPTKEAIPVDAPETVQLGPETAMAQTQVDQGGFFTTGDREANTNFLEESQFSAMGEMSGSIPPSLFVDLWSCMAQTDTVISKPNDLLGGTASRPHWNQPSGVMSFPASGATVLTDNPHTQSSGVVASRGASKSNQQPETMDRFIELLEAYTEQSLPPLTQGLWLSHASRDSEAMPLLLFPPLPGDKHIHAILERTRSNVSSIGPPNLVDFLIDNPSNTLSVDLKDLLAPIRRTRRTSEFLATYWVLYLLLRWQVVRDDESYQSLPLWLRPTPLQLTVLHPVAADLIAWPEIREELIRMSISDSRKIHDVSIDVGKHLSVDIQVGELDLLNGPQHLHTQIANLGNWKLDEAFFDRYPQWGGLRNRHGSLARAVG